jgi:hypothetical protein
MKNADKNRDPEAARKRARNDARCALRKLGLLGALERIAAKPDTDPQGAYQHSLSFVATLRKELGIR